MHRPALSILLAPALLATPPTQNTPPFDLVSEYVRELGEMWAIQQKVDQEMVEDKTSDNPSTRLLMTSIRHSARVNTVLHTNISMLKKMRITRKPHNETIGLFITFYKQKIQVMDEMSKGASTIVSGPKPGMDYGKILARSPKITAALEEIDKSLFQLTSLMFAILIDMKADSQNRANHLLISKEQRDTLARQIEDNFGASLDTDKRYTVASAHLFKMKLLEFKCSDEAWE